MTDSALVAPPAPEARNDLSAKWQEMLEIIRGELSPASFFTAFANATPLNFADGCLTVGAANAILKNYIEHNHLELLTVTARRFFGELLIVKVVVSEGLYRKHRQAISADKAAEKIEKESPAAQPDRRPLFAKNGHSFANFVAGNCNEFALAAAREIAVKADFSPLIISGDHGAGKTHLLHAICHSVSERQPAAKIICQNADNFVRAFSAATVEKRTPAFRDRYENCDLLALDDFQYLGDGNKQGSQRELTQVLEHLEQRGVRVIIATRITPAQVEGIYPPLFNRLKSGLFVKLNPPDCAVRRGLLLARAAAEQMNLTAEIVDYLSEILPADAREIVGATHRLALQIKLQNHSGGEPLSLNQVKELFAPQVPPRVSAEMILETVSSVYGVAVADIVSSQRRANIATARRAAAHLLRTVQGGSLSEIGTALGKRSHATILSLLKNPPFDSELNKNRFAAVLARLGNPVAIEKFIALPENRIFAV